MRRFGALAAAVLLLLALPGRGWGQSLALSPATLTMPTAGVAQLNSGWVDSGSMRVTVDPGSTTTNWTLYVRATNATLSGAGKALSDLMWRVEGSSQWRSVETLDQAVQSGTGTAEVTVYFRVRLRWSADPPGSYGTGLTFSLTTS